MQWLIFNSGYQALFLKINEASFISLILLLNDPPNTISYLIFEFFGIFLFIPRRIFLNLESSIFSIVPYVFILIEALEFLAQSAQEVIEIVGGGDQVGDQGHLDEALWRLQLGKDQTSFNAQWEINSCPDHKSQHNVESVDSQESEMGDKEVTKRQD